MSFLFTFSPSYDLAAQYLIIPNKYFIDEGKSGRSSTIFDGGRTVRIALLAW